MLLKCIKKEKKKTSKRAILTNTSAISYNEKCTKQRYNKLRKDDRNSCR